MKTTPARALSSTFDLSSTARLCAVVASVSLAAGCSSGGGGGTAPVTTASSASTALTNAGFGQLVQALEDAGLTATVESAAAATVLAPTDAALAAPLANGGDFAALDDASKADLLAYHVLDGKFDGADLNGPAGDGIGAVSTLDGRTVRVDRVGTGLWANDVPLTVLDVPTANGFVQRLDGVLLPPEADLVATMTERGYGIFAVVLINAGFGAVLTDPASDLTILAPSDAALLALLGTPTLDELLAPENADDLANVLRYHAVIGSVSAAEGLAAGEVSTILNNTLFFATENDELRVSGALAQSFNLPSGNGIVHGLDRLMGADTVADSLVGYDLGTLDTAVETAAIGPVLADLAAPATLFAPTDDAFAALPAGELDALLDAGTGGELPGLLSYHAVAGKRTLAELVALDAPDALAGGAVIVEELGDTTWVNDARVVHADLPASTGYVQRIDRVLSPTTDIYATLQDRGLDTLVAAIDAAGATALFDGSQPNQRTLLAPSEAAFAALPAGMLDCLLEPAQAGTLQSLILGHLADGVVTAGDCLDAGQIVPFFGGALDVTIGVDGLPAVDGIQLSIVNVPCTNGVVHVIDAVLSGALEAALPDVPTLLGNQVELGAFVAALNAADLSTTLAGDGPFTVLAPGFSAFIQIVDDLGLESFDALLSPENSDLLTAILEHHIIPSGGLCMDDLVAASPLTTLGGETLIVVDEGGPVFDGQAGLTFGDLLAINGVVHVIDAVILPPSVLLGQSGATVTADVVTPIAALPSAVAGGVGTQVTVGGASAATLVRSLGGTASSSVAGPQSGLAAGAVALPAGLGEQLGTTPLVLLVGPPAGIDGATARFSFEFDGASTLLAPAAPIAILDAVGGEHVAVWPWAAGAVGVVVDRADDTSVATDDLALLIWLP